MEPNFNSLPITPKYTRKPDVFLCFQRIQKEGSDMAGVPITLKGWNANNGEIKFYQYFTEI